MKRIILLSVLQLLYFCFLFVASAQTNKASISKPSADTVFTYHSNGIIESKGLVSNQKKTGVWFFYDEEGNITLKETYVNDVQNGNFSSYYKNGKVFKKGILKNDLVQGLCLEYYESGALQFKNNYIEDELNGLSQEYYENGKLKKITNYIKGQLNGSYVSYYDNGVVETKGNYKSGVQIGIWSSYNEKGKLTSTENYGQFKPVTISSYTGRFTGLNGYISLNVTDDGSWYFDGLRNSLSGYYTKSIDGTNFTLSLYRPMSDRERAYYGESSGFLMFTVSGNSNSREIRLDIESQQASNTMLPNRDSSYWLNK